MKALGNKEGPQVLAAEWVGTALADWIGLRTFKVAKMTVEADDEIQLGHGRRAEAGTAIAVKAEPGASWGGSVAELRAVANIVDVGRMVVFDTWVRNCDRHPPDLAVRKPNYDNVFLSAAEAPEAKFILTAIDHTHCFSCGRDLNAQLARIDNVKDAAIYGRFPEFETFLDRGAVRAAVARLRDLSREFVEGAVREIADDWQVPPAARSALVDLVCDRAEYVADTISGTLFPQIDWTDAPDE